MVGSGENVSQSTSLLNETQRVLNQQVKIVQNQQSQATKILRVALTIAGLLLTTVSIAVTVILNAGSESNLLTGIDITLSSAATGLLLLYLFVAISGAFTVIFVSAFRVLSPESVTLSVFTIRPPANTELFKHLLSVYDTIIPFISISFDDERPDESYSLRPGVDSDEVRTILDSNTRTDDIIEYNAGCIEGNKNLIDNNRQLLSNIYTTAIVITVAMILLFLSGAAYVMPAPA